MNAIALVTATTAEPVTRTEMKLWLRVDEHDVSEDPLIDSLITRARLRFEEVNQRSCLVQTFDYYLDVPPDDLCPIELPKAPLVDVIAITGFSDMEGSDTGGTAMSTSGWYVDTAREFGRVVPLSAFTYPSATRSINPTIVRFTAGYSTSTTGVPESVKTEIKQLAAALYEHRGDELEQGTVLAGYGSVVTELSLPTWG